MPCLSCEMCSFNGALLPFSFFFFFWTMETEQLSLRESSSLQRQPMTNAVCYQQSLDTLQGLCFHSSTSFRGYHTRKKKKKKKLCYCFNPNLIADCSRRPADDARRPSGSSRAVLECSWLRAGYWVSVRCDVQGCKQSVNDSQLPGDEGQEYWVLSTELWSTEEPPAGLGQAVLNSDRSVSALQVCYPEESMFDMLWCMKIKGMSVLSSSLSITSTEHGQLLTKCCAYLSYITTQLKLAEQWARETAQFYKPKLF